MSDEEHTTNADSFTTLSEASFAEDWGSKEDKVYDTAEAKLLALIEAASPGPWSAHNRAERMPGKMADYYRWPVVRHHPPEFHDKADKPYTSNATVVLLAHNRRPEDARLAALAPGLAAAVDVVRALRGQGSELEGNWWHLKDCGAAHDWVHSQEVSECDLACHEAQEALARWDEVLEGR